MILKQEEIRFIFNPYVLLPGDILLMNTYEERLRAKMGCKYEHAAIYIGDAHLMEANGSHVLMSHIYSYAFREQDHACVLRLRKASPIKLQDIARSSRKQMGREYVNTNQFRYVRALKNTDQKDLSNRSFCSRLVAQSYSMEGIQLLPNADYCEPDDFLNSELLEVVPNAIVPFTEDLTTVVMNNQAQREATEIDSPNAELFSALGQLFEQDIQDLGQASMAVLNQPEKAQDAIEVVKQSRMFKHMEDVKRDTPWIFDDDQFFANYEDIDRALHFLYSQMNHYDNTILPYYKELHLQLITIAYYYPQCKFHEFLRDYIKAMVEEAVICRKRFEELYVETFSRYEKEFVSFVDRFGFYSNFEYKDTPTDISFLFNDLMKAWAKQDEQKK